MIKIKRDYASEFKEIVESAGYELLSPYVDTKKKVKLKCDKDHEYEVTPGSFKSGSRCPVCAGKCPIAAKKEFERQVSAVGYTLLGSYVSAMKKVKLKCDKDHEYEVIPSSFKSGSRCPVCAGKCSIAAKKEFEQQVIESGYTLLSPYVSVMKKVELKCDKDHEYEADPHSFKSGSRCPVCAGKCPIESKKYFERQVIESGYTLLSPYVKNSKKVGLKCDKDHEYEVIPSSFKRGVRCPVCAGKCSISAKKDFERQVADAGYTLLSPYVNNSKKVKLKCDKDHEYEVAPDTFKRGVRCPVCACNGNLKSLYIQRDKTNSNVSKIGITHNIERRHKTIKKSAATYGHEFETFFLIDLSTEIQKAVNIESAIKKMHKLNRLYPGKKIFDGSTEILTITPEQLKLDVERILEQYKRENYEQH